MTRTGGKLVYLDAVDGAVAGAFCSHIVCSAGIAVATSINEIGSVVETYCGLDVAYVTRFMC